MAVNAALFTPKTYWCSHTYVRLYVYIYIHTRTHVCTHQRACTLACIHTLIGGNISEWKSRTERTEKCKKPELVFFPTARGRNWYCSTSSRRYTEFAQATIIRGIFIPGPSRPGLSQNRHNTHNFPILQSELAWPSTGCWLPGHLSSTWRWAERIEHIFPNSKYAK